MGAAWECLAKELFKFGDLEDVLAPEAKVSVLELTHYMRGQLLRDADWAGMAWSLEIRVPFVDSKLIDDLAPFLFSKRGIKKVEMLKAVSHPLYREIVTRSKTGFDLPIRDWLLESVGGNARGLRDWSKYLYLNWCRIHNCEPIFYQNA